MKGLFVFLAIAGVVLARVLAQEVAAEEMKLPAPEPVIEEDLTSVSVLGYHDFSETQRETAMRIRTSKFRDQMQVLKDADLPVISMQDFVEWKQGEKVIPKRSVVITIDDGWKSVYTDAYPILKEFGYPFTIFVYQNYIDGGGRALTTQMIEEMMANGATVGSHSVSHPFPRTVRKYKRRGGKEYADFIEKELGASRRFIEKKFNTTVRTFAYPGGFFTNEMVAASAELGYSHLFTVLPGKVSKASADRTLPRYIILGSHDKVFTYATRFQESRDGELGDESFTEINEIEFPVSPEAGAIINSRLPTIRVDFTESESLDPASLEMRVAGFGKVPATYSQDTNVYSWELNRRLRQKICKVQVRWEEVSPEGEVAKSMNWQFQIDRGAAYLQPD